jgi:D-beta-D-heptose 7-phosphate kinase/D-beta-D-heptose 1-phosphate adenosyltransferase
VDWEESRPISDSICRTLVESLPPRIQSSHAVVLSDYGKGFLAPELIAAVIQAAKSKGVPVLVDPKGTDYTRYRGATIITPNRRESEEALGRKLPGLHGLPEAAEQLMEIAGLSSVVITLGADGIFYRTRKGESGRVPTVARAVFDVTGAGDTVIAMLTLGVASGVALEAAVHLANHAAGIVVGRRGTSSVTREELAASLGELPSKRGKVLAPAEVDSAVAGWRSQGFRIAFTNGCFDVLHSGHVELLQFARSKGDVLLVGVNDDESVQRLKGPTRPVNPLADRLEVLAALEAVDGVVPFSEDTPARLIEQVTPHALIKGEDWADRTVVGSAWVEAHGGQVHLAPLKRGRSTTAILQRVREGRSGPQAS